MTLEQLIVKEDWDKLVTSLDSMTNSQFRRAEANVRKCLTNVPNELFWKAYLCLMKYRHQSFITCILSVRHLAKSGELDFNDDNARELSLWLKDNSPECAQKIMDMAIPLLNTESQMDGLLHLFGHDAGVECIPVLVRQDTPLAYYMLFKVLTHADSQEMVKKCIVFLAQKHNDLAFNMASILKSYFGMDQLKMNFSLKIEPYEHCYMVQSFANFNNILNGRRPKL